MMLGSTLASPLLLPSVLGGGGTPTPTPGTTVYADGASMLSSTPLAMTRAGFTTTGATTTYAVSNAATFPRHLNPYQNGGQSDMGALDNIGGVPTGKYATELWVFTTDSGFTNNSTVAPPKPVAASLNPGYLPVRNDGSGHWYLPLEWIGATHGAGREFARLYSLLEYRVTDSIGTVGPWTAAAWADEHPSGYTRTTSAGFWATPDLAAYANGDGFIDWRAYPVYGNSSAILSTLDTPKNQSVKPIPFTKFAGAATQVYMASTGNDTTGDGSSGAPYLTAGKCLTVLGANRNGGEVLVKDNVAWGAVAVTGAISNTCYVTFRKDPAAGAGVTLTLPAANTTVNTKHIRFLDDITVVRGGAVFFNCIAGGSILFDVGSTLNINSLGTVSFCNTLTDFKFVRSSILNYVGAALNGNTNVESSLQYGLNIPNANGLQVIHQRVVNGCTFNGIGYGQGSNPYSASGTIIANTRYGGTGGATGIFDPVALAGETYLSDILILNSVVAEYISATSNLSIGLSRDPSPTFGTSNILEFNSASVGAGVRGRINGWYDNNPGAGVARGHLSCDVRGNIWTQFNIKGGEFVGIEGGEPLVAPLRWGNIPQIYGTGFSDNVIVYPDAAGGTANGNYLNDFSQMYAGVNTYVGAVASQRNDIWVDYKGVSYAGVAGAGGSNLTLVSGSPAIGRLRKRILPKTLGGVARPAVNDDAGPYSATG